MMQPNDYIERLNRAIRKRNRGDDRKYLILAGIVILIIIISVILIKCSGKPETVPVTPTAPAPKATGSDATSSDASASNAMRPDEAQIQAAIDQYSDLGIVSVNGFLNVRETPSTSAHVVGKLYDESACEIQSTEGEWYKITSGEVEGYIHSQYVITGDEARTAARALVKQRAIVTADKLNIRKGPSTESDSIGQALSGESYEVKDLTDGWVEIANGYISADYVELQFALNVARKLDMKSMVLNLYDNLGISNVQNYLNIREKPSEDGKIIGKMPSKSAGNILESVEGGWYKIQSGGITGYVKSDYILTGGPAKDEAMKRAELMAIVNTDVLNVRTEPSTDAKIWTQISNSERYSVLSQTDGWVEIELDTTSAFVATEFVDVRYALDEAIKFSPLEEKANAGSSLRSKIVNYALQFLGNPYVWGGTSLTKGADCSGFTMSVLGHFGIGLPHYSGSQAKMGKAIKSSEMRPGDLLFYSNSGGTINHVAMYIGNGQIVHAANRRSGIKISSWNYRTPARIRNVIGD